MRTNRRTQSTIPTSTIDDLLLPAAGPNGVPPDRLTPRQRREEIVHLLSRGFLRKAAGISPFTKPASAGPPGRVT